MNDSRPATNPACLAEVPPKAGRRRSNREHYRILRAENNRVTVFRLFPRRPDTDYNCWPRISSRVPGPAVRRRRERRACIRPTFPISERASCSPVLALAEYGSFVAAAAYLKTSQPALTRTIKRVERVLGVTLFARNTRRVEITAAGREFVAVAERMLNDLKHTVRNLSEVTNEQRGRITIATYSSFAINPLVFLVRRYRETRPLIEIRIREGRQSEIVEDVRNGAADFGVGYINSLPELMESSPLRKEPLLALIPLSHPLAAKKRPRIRLVDLKDEPLVSAPNDTYLRRLTDAAGGLSGVQPALHGHRRSADQHPSPCLRRRRDRDPAFGMPARPAVGRGVSRRAVVRAVALRRGRAHHAARPLPHTRRRGDGDADQRADGEAEERVRVERPRRARST
jgi:DNA-binding transcriptional LysR family regulator